MCRIFVNYQGHWQCDDVALSAIHTLVEHRIHGLFKRAHDLAHHCHSDSRTLKASDIELAMWLSGLWTSPHPPAIVLKCPATCPVSVDEIVATGEAPKPRKIKSGAFDGREVKDTAAKPAAATDDGLPPYFEDRVRRFGLFYREQFPEQFTDQAEYDEAGENVATRLKKEQTAVRRRRGWVQTYNHLIRFVRCHESLRELAQLKRMAGNFDDSLRSDPGAFNDYVRCVAQDFRNGLSFAVWHIGFSYFD